MTEKSTEKPQDFIRAKITRDLQTGKYNRPVRTRFPPEPNGYLHIGHAKAICLNFGIAEEFDGAACNLRFDDTNPTTEDMEYVEAIQDDIRWLGFEWDGDARFASDYFERMHGFAVDLIKKGKAYVCELTLDEIREYRGTVTEPGKESPYRNRPVDENLDLFDRMRAGEFEDGRMVLRAKIDMASPNMLMRDPILYRIRRAHHYRTGDDWCIYPMYDFAHCLGDAIEGVTHSLCSLEFKDNRELYDWVVNEVGFDEPPEQTEFARFNLEYTVLSKRKLIRLVEEGLVDGWDDPRMPTIAGLRRRGVPAAAIRTLCDMIGVARVPNRVDMGKLEFAIRDELNHEVPRVLCVLRPLRVVITNFPEGETDVLDAPLYPHDVPKEATRPLPFTRDLFIERDDFSEDPPKGFFRMAPGREVRLRYGYLLTCDEVVKDADGNVVELRCSYDPESRGGNPPDGRKVRGTIHWVSATESVPCRVRLYDRLFSVPDPEDVTDDGDFVDNLNPASVEVLDDSRVEPWAAEQPAGTSFQFERQGYFVRNVGKSLNREGADGPVFNRIVPLRDTWAKKSRGHTKPRPRIESDRGSSASKSGPQPNAPQLSADEEGAVSELVERFGLGPADATVIATTPGVDAFYQSVVGAEADPALTANLVINELLRADRGVSMDAPPLKPAAFAKLVTLLGAGTINRAGARAVLDAMLESGADPNEVVESQGLAQISDDAELEEVVAGVIDSHATELAAYRDGKKALFGFFMGEVMKVTRGRANPSIVKETLGRLLDS